MILYFSVEIKRISLLPCISKRNNASGNTNDTMKTVMYEITLRLINSAISYKKWDKLIHYITSFFHKTKPIINQFNPTFIFV